MTSWARVVGTGGVVRLSLGRLEGQLFSSGMLSPARARALEVARTALAVALDFMPAMPEGSAEMGEATAARKFEYLLGE